MPKPSNIRQKKSPEISLDSFCVGHVLLGMGLALKCGLYVQWDYIGEN